MGRPTNKTRYIADVLRLYRDERWSAPEVARHLGVGTSSVLRWLREEGVQVETRKRNPNAGRTPERQAEINAKVSQSVRARLAQPGANRGGAPAHRQEQRVCQCPCQRAFTVPESSAQVYFERTCARRAAGRNQHQRTQEEWLASGQSLCPCGQRIPYDQRHRKYHSNECRREFGGKREPDAGNYVLYLCENRDDPECPHGDTPQSRYRKNGSHKYGSPQCASRHTKRTRHYAVTDMDMVLDNSWEVLFVGLCRYYKIDVERYERNGTAGYPGAVFSPDDGVHGYAPDFMVRAYGVKLAVEVKGDNDPADLVRWRVFREQTGIALAVVRQPEFERLLHAQGRTGFAKVLLALAG